MPSTLPTKRPCSNFGVGFNLLSPYQHQVTPDQPYRQPGTLRVAVFQYGAVLGVMGRDVAVKLAAAWGGLRYINRGWTPPWTG